MSSGCDCRVALYIGNCSCRKVFFEESKATPMWVGFSLVSTSIMAFMKPKIAEVFTPRDEMRGDLLKAKCAR